MSATDVDYCTPDSVCAVQVLQAEADEAAGRAIQQYMYRAFNDMSGEPTSDSNPLLRQHKLSRTNPLL
jgi:hypothetical protein